MSLRGRDMAIVESGWYEENERIGPMKEDYVYKIFT